MQSPTECYDLQYEPLHAARHALGGGGSITESVQGFQLDAIVRLRLPGTHVWYECMIQPHAPPPVACNSSILSVSPATVVCAPTLLTQRPRPILSIFCLAGSRTR